MENRYFRLLNLETLAVYLSEELQVQPENSLPFAVYNFNNPSFDQYPNPTLIVEGIVIEVVLEVPSEIRLWRLRVILDIMGLINSIENALNTLPEPQKTAALSIWEYGNEIERNSNTVLFIQNSVNLTSEQVDNIFIQANNIEL